jgi:hypothetical protein
MSTRFFTNHGEQTLFKKFQGVFESNPDIEWFDALAGYLRSSGYFALRPYLEKVPHIRILVGINVDAIMADYHRRGLLFLTDPTMYVATIPIASARPEEEAELSGLVKKIQTAKRAGNQALVQSLEREMDVIVFRLYDLTPEEIALVQEATPK